VLVPCLQRIVEGVMEVRLGGGGGDDDLGGSALLQLCEYLSVSLMWKRAVKWLSQMCRYEPYGGESLYIFIAS
jgi:hypothetical protein